MAFKGTYLFIYLMELKRNETVEKIEIKKARKIQQLQLGLLVYTLI